MLKIYKETRVEVWDVGLLDCSPARDEILVQIEPLKREEFLVEYFKYEEDFNQRTKIAKEN